MSYGSEKHLRSFSAAIGLEGACIVVSLLFLSIERCSLSSAFFYLWPIHALAPSFPPAPLFPPSKSILAAMGVVSIVNVGKWLIAFALARAIRTGTGIAS